MWDRLRKQVALEREQLHRLLDTSRPFFRHAYLFTLEWDRMKPLVLGCQETLNLVEAAGLASREEPKDRKALSVML